MTIEPAELLHRIDELTSRLAWSLTDDWATTGELGLAWLDLYELDGDQQALNDGLDRLRVAVAATVNHLDRPRWRLGLGLGYAERARHRWVSGDYRAAVDDYHASADCLSAVCTEPEYARERLAAAVALGDLCWERYWISRHLAGVDKRRALMEVDRLLARVDPLRAAPADPAELIDLRLIAGLARLERHALTGDRADLDRGIDALLTASVRELPATDRRRCRAGAELVEALRRRAELGSRGDDLARAVGMARAIIDQAGPLDTTAWLLLNRYTASAAYALWRRDRRRADLDFAYACWQVVIPEGLDARSGREYRALLADWTSGLGG